MKPSSALTYFMLVVLANTASAQQDTLQWKKMRKLDFLQGNWEVEMESRLSMNGPWEKTKGKSIFQLTLDSTFVEEAYTGTKQGKPFYSKSFFAVNNANYKYQRVFIDAPHGVMISFEGDDRMDSLIFDRPHTYPNGKIVHLRVVYEKVSKDHFTLQSMRRPEGSEVWDVNGRMGYTRVK